jgi:ABC-type branched-subunit amino acid transport system substrate-binding protein
VQAEQRFITENHAILMTGSTSSAVAVAMNKLAQREKVLYVTGISGSNDTTGRTACATVPPELLRTDRRRAIGPCS